MEKIISKLKIPFLYRKQESKPIIKDGVVCRCERCGSKKVGKTYYFLYSRGWNDLCNQAIGDTGAYCNNCGWVTFVNTLDEYVKKLPKWCRAYR